MCEQAKMSTFSQRNIKFAKEYPLKQLINNENSFYFLFIFFSNSSFPHQREIKKTVSIKKEEQKRQD